MEDQVAEKSQLRWTNTDFLNTIFSAATGLLFSATCGVIGKE